MTKRQLDSPGDPNTPKKTLTVTDDSDEEISTQDILVNMINEDMVPDNSKDDLILVNPKVINTLLSTISKLSKSVDALRKDVSDIKKSNEELIKLVQEKPSETSSAHPTVDERSIISSWGRKFHVRRSEYIQYYKMVEKAKILKSFVEAEDVYITRKHRVKAYNTHEEFKLKEKLAISKMIMEVDLLKMTANNHKVAYEKIDKEIWDLIDGSNENSEVKEKLKNRWGEETRKAEIKAKELSARNINFMKSLPTEYPYEGYQESQKNSDDDPTPTDETYSSVIKRTINNKSTSAASEGNTAPEISITKSRVNKYNSKSKGASNFVQNSKAIPNSSANKYNLRYKTNSNGASSNKDNSGRYYNDNNYFNSRNYHNGRADSDDGYQKQKKKNNNNRNFQKGTGKNSNYLEEMDIF